MDQLDTPGLLIDAQSIFFVDREADSPYLEIARATASQPEVFEAFRQFQAMAVGYDLA